MKRRPRSVLGSGRTATVFLLSVAAGCTLLFQDPAQSGDELVRHLSRLTSGRLGLHSKEYDMDRITGKLSPRFVWLFAAGALVLGIVAVYATAGMGAKVTAGVYGVVVAALAFASTFTTSARTRTGVLAFLLAAVAAGAIYFVLVSSVVADATTAVAGTDAEAVAAGTAMGNFLGAFAAIVAFAETAFFGIGGVVFGAKAQNMLASQPVAAPAVG
jgi:hypothetical protein